MSLLNKMLRDLDARHAPSQDRAALPDDVHLPATRRERARSPAVLVLALLAAAGWYFVAQPDKPPRAVAVVPAPRPLPLSAAPPPVAAAPVAPPIAAAPVTPAPAVSAPAAAAPAPMPPVAKPNKEVTGGPRSTGKISGAKESVAGAAAVSPAQPTPAVPAAKEANEPPPPEQSGIEKRPHGSLAGAAAENEYRKALAALRQGGTSTAMQGLRGALRIDKRHVSARQALLSLLVEQQQWSEAESVLEEGLALDPAQNGWALALARLQLENGKFPTASATLELYARHAERNADYQAFRALLFQKQKRLEEAADRYRAALALKPGEARWWYGLGLVLEAERKPQEAREAYLRARESGNLSADLASAVEQRLR